MHNGNDLYEGMPVCRAWWNLPLPHEDWQGLHVQRQVSGLK